MRKKRFWILACAAGFFVAYWLLCNAGSDPYMQESLEIQRIYGYHDLSVGYFSIRSYMVIHVVALLIYLHLLLWKEKEYEVIRILARGRAWRRKTGEMGVYVVMFTLLQFLTDIVMMLLFHSWSRVWESGIFLFLAEYFPVVLFHFMTVGALFLFLQFFISRWKAVVGDLVVCVVVYFLVEAGFFFYGSWDPFSPLYLLARSIYDSVTVWDIAVAYLNTCFAAAVVILAGAVCYHRKEFLSHEK